MDSNTAHKAPEYIEVDGYIVVMPPGGGATTIATAAERDHVAFFDPPPGGSDDLRSAMLRDHNPARFDVIIVRHPNHAIDVFGRVPDVTIAPSDLAKRVMAKEVTGDPGARDRAVAKATSALAEIKVVSKAMGIPIYDLRGMPARVTPHIITLLAEHARQRR